jgi:hypothetical protein
MVILERAEAVVFVGQWLVGAYNQERHVSFFWPGTPGVDGPIQTRISLHSRSEDANSHGGSARTGTAGTKGRRRHLNSHVFHPPSQQPGATSARAPPANPHHLLAPIPP